MYVALDVSVPGEEDTGYAAKGSPGVLQERRAFSERYLRYSDV